MSLITYLSELVFTYPDYLLIRGSERKNPKTGEEDQFEIQVLYTGNSPESIAHQIFDQLSRKSDIDTKICGLLDPMNETELAGIHEIIDAILTRREAILLKNIKTPSPDVITKEEQIEGPSPELDRQTAAPTSVSNTVDSKISDFREPTDSHPDFPGRTTEEVFDATIRRMATTPPQADAKGSQMDSPVETPSERVERRKRKYIRRDPTIEVPRRAMKSATSLAQLRKEPELKNPGLAPISLVAVRDALENIGEPATLAMIAHYLLNHNVANDHQNLNSILVQGRTIDWFTESPMGEWAVKSA